jgi:membrane-bound lytic murein transglycosylase A
MRGPGSREQKERRVKESFDFFKAAGRGEKRSVLFTGYYEPILEGSFVKKTQYRHPIYEVPGDMVVANLGKFKTKFRGERIGGRVVGREVVPYYNRKEIDGDGVLANRGLEIAWLADPVDVFFLHIQGSGLVRLADGGFMQVSYAESNGRPYRGIGRLLLDQGKVTEKDLSLGGIKKYLRDNPGEMAAILNHNESYVFYRIVEEGPVGSIGVPLTGGRSIATDLELFPRGALSFIRLRKPLLDENKRITSWVGFSRFVLNQDAGGVIKGPGRADVFCGRGLRRRSSRAVSAKKENFISWSKRRGGSR